MTRQLEGYAIVYCEGMFGTTNGKTAHGLVRFCRRYKILSVVDSRKAGKDSGKVLEKNPNGIPILASIEDAVRHSEKLKTRATHLIVGLAPDGGRLPHYAKEDIKTALNMGLNVVSGLHDFLSEKLSLKEIAMRKGVQIIDVRKPPRRDELHFFTGKIDEVESLKIALLGTDSAVGKRTTGWVLVKALKKLGCSVEMIGTGQTSWMQGARYCIIMDTLVNDFVSGEIEHIIHQAWKEQRPEVILIEGQGSLLNPAYPGGFEILAAGRPDLVILQHAPARKHYDGFPKSHMHPLSTQIKAIEIIGDIPVIAITINHEDIDKKDINSVSRAILNETGIFAFDVLIDDGEELADLVISHLADKRASEKKGALSPERGGFRSKLAQMSTR